MAMLYTPTITYDPVTDPFGKRANHYQIERSPGDTFLYECLADAVTGYPTTFYQPSSLVIAIAGSFKSERYCYPGPRAGYAVFVGPGNGFNTGGMPVPKVQGHFMSTQRGELTAAIAALQTVLHICKKGLLPRGLKRVVIKSDSQNVVTGITERVYTWINKGWIALGNSQICDWDLWEDLLRLLGEARGRWGVEICFWLVPPAWNKDARVEAAAGTRVPPPAMELLSCRGAAKSTNRSCKLGMLR